jgi:hypothetical protein
MESGVCADLEVMAPCVGRLLLLCIAGISVLVPVTGTASAQANAASAAYAASASNISSLTQTVVGSYQERSSGSDSRYYRVGLWISDDMACWTCDMGPAVADAVLARRDASRLPVVIASFDRALSDHQAADGSFTGGDPSPGINTAFFVPQSATALIAIGDRLDPATRARWTAAVTGGASYLINAGHVNWYANGNLNLAYAEVLYLAWRVSGQQRFADAYEAEWSFLVSPPAPRWAGYGLILTRAPTRPDGSDGAGYLTEDGGSGPGFDPEYTELQIDTASSLYVLSHDARALRLMNLLVNQELPRVDASFTLDATNGSRHSLRTAFMTSGLAVLVNHGRADLAPLLPVQTARIDSEYQTFMVYTHRNYYFGLSRWLTPLLLDANGVGVVAPRAALVPVARTGSRKVKRPRRAKHHRRASKRHRTVRHASAGRR